MTHATIRATRHRVALWCTVALLSTTASAAPLEREDVPEPLQPWIDWVLRGHEAELCPFLNGAMESEGSGCIWPAELDLDLRSTEGSFTQSWMVYARARVPLPGDAKRWPLDVLVDGQPAPVTSRNGQPSVELSPGTHSISGRFRSIQRAARTTA